MRSRSSSVRRSRTSDRLPRLSSVYAGFGISSAIPIAPNTLRIGSPLGASTLMTSAPQSASSPAAAGAATHTPSSRPGGRRRPKGGGRSAARREYCTLKELKLGSRLWSSQSVPQGGVSISARASATLEVDTRDTPEQAELRRSARQLAPGSSGPANVAISTMPREPKRLPGQCDAGWLSCE